MIKWLKEGYGEAIKKVINAHKIIFKKTVWFGVFMFPFVVAEAIIIYSILGLLWTLLAGEPPTSPIIDN